MLGLVSEFQRKQWKMGPPNQSMSQRPHYGITSACLPRRPAVAYLFLVRLAQDRLGLTTLAGP